MNYENLLRGHSLKVTPQRLGILSLMEKEGHVSVEDLFTKIKKTFPSISLATLYKNMTAMISVDLVKEVTIPNMKAKYEIIKAEHSHVLCEKCGEFKDIDLDMSGVLKTAKENSHYEMHHVDLVLSGICPECQSS
ncbi:MAG: transcriptional repressor [Epsilonproteobacteria bacterium]|nr:MAG: transcriptional repressor [Campylobacterota bacterium]